MKKKGIIMCPDHGSQTVIVDCEPTVEMRHMSASSFDLSPSEHTGLCKKCKKRLTVYFKD